MRSAREIAEEQNKIRQEERKNNTYGLWKLDTDRLVLDYSVKGRQIYEIDLERCNNAAQILDWIVQLSHKTWATPQVIYDFISALDRILGYRLQGRVCPGGHYIDRAVNWKEVIALRKLAVEIDAD